MKVSDAYNSLTPAARRESVQMVCAQLGAKGSKASYEYVKQVMQGIRKNPCSDDVARVISGHFIGYRGINVTPQDVNGVSPEAAGAASAQAG